jgi:hypothetical protein
MSAQPIAQGPRLPVKAPAPSEPSAYDPLVAALAQLVRDRWAAEHVSSQEPVALGAVPSIMATMVQQDSDGKEAPT